MNSKTAKLIRKYSNYMLREAAAAKITIRDRKYYYRKIKQAYLSLPSKKRYEAKELMREKVFNVDSA